MPKRIHRIFTVLQQSINHQGIGSAHELPNE
jgi:hypothetical protein